MEAFIGVIVMCMCVSVYSLMWLYDGTVLKGTGPRDPKAERWIFPYKEQQAYVCQ